jgi:hypothetical protein
VDEDLVDPRGVERLVVISRRHKLRHEDSKAAVHRLRGGGLREGARMAVPKIICKKYSLINCL